jgi:outer membrane protein assembly factor BamA
MTAGGSHDVRGWAERMLGPKFPTPILSASDSTLVVDSDFYTPIGGFNRLYGSMELRFPVGLVPERLAAHAFVDAGRIWTKDERFTSSDDPYGVERLFWATGVGFDYATPVGSIRLSVGYKLNPSFLDLVDPIDALRALLSDVPRDEWVLDEHGIRRFRLHIGFGTLM